MNYLSQYNALIATRKLMGRKKGQGIYYEWHHIIPQCFEGGNSNENKVLLTGKEHFLAHLLLVEIYNGEKKMKMWHALNCMLRIKSTPARIGIKVSGRQVDRIKKQVAEISSSIHKGKPKGDSHWQNKKGSKRKPEHVAQSVKTRIENGNNRCSEETKKKIRKKRKLQVIDGSKISEAQIRKGSNKWSEERKLESRKNHSNKKKVQQMTGAGVFVKDFDSLQEAADYLGVTICCISDCINGRQKTSAGYIFKLKAV